MPKKITSTKLPENILQVLEEIKECGEPVVITKRSRPIAVLIEFEGFMALQERLRELEGSQLQQIVAQGRQEHEQGRTRRIKSLRKLRFGPHSTIY